MHDFCRSSARIATRFTSRLQSFPMPCTPRMRQYRPQSAGFMILPGTNPQWPCARTAYHFEYSAGSAPKISTLPLHNPPTGKLPLAIACQCLLCCPSTAATNEPEGAVGVFTVVLCTHTRALPCGLARLVMHASRSTLPCSAVNGLTAWRTEPRAELLVPLREPGFVEEASGK